MAFDLHMYLLNRYHGVAVQKKNEEEKNTRTARTALQ